jgi:hypothetical protein
VLDIRAHEKMKETVISVNHAATISVIYQSTPPFPAANPAFCILMTG